MKRFSDVLPGIIIVLMVMMVALFFWQQQGDFFGKGKIISETRTVADFDKVSISVSGLIMIEQGQKESLRIEADEKLMEYITTEVIDEELKISYKKHPSFSFPITGAKFYLVVREIEKFSLGSSAKMESSVITANKLELIINGSGQMIMDLEVENLVANLNGSGRFKLEGVANQQQIVVSGSGGFYGKSLEGSKGKVTLAGSGKVEVNTTDNLDVSLSGSGSVYYLGDPVLGEINTSGSGKMEKL